MILLRNRLIPPSPAETLHSRYMGNGSELQAFPHRSLVPLLPFFLVQKNLFLFSSLMELLFISIFWKPSPHFGSVCYLFNIC